MQGHCIFLDHASAVDGIGRRLLVKHPQGGLPRDVRKASRRLEQGFAEFHFRGLCRPNRSVDHPLRSGFPAEGVPNETIAPHGPQVGHDGPNRWRCQVGPVEALLISVIKLHLKAVGRRGQLSQIGCSVAQLDLNSIGVLIGKIQRCLRNFGDGAGRIHNRQGDCHRNWGRHPIE